MNKSRDEIQADSGRVDAIVRRRQQRKRGAMQETLATTIHEGTDVNLKVNDSARQRPNFYAAPYENFWCVRGTTRGIYAYCDRQAEAERRASRINELFDSTT
jgi:hypothetical protein